MTQDKTLFVDDDENILSAYQRQLRKQFVIDTALGGEPGLAAIREKGPYSIVVSDMRMPGMDGIQFLSRVKSEAPDTVRMMLTGNSDIQTAIQAVNEGSIFRFMTKPCPTEQMAEVLTAGLRQYRLVCGERELLEKTLSGSIRVLTEMLTLMDPHSFGRSEKLKECSKALAAHMGVEELWEIELAAMLSQIGVVTVPTSTAAKARNGLPLTISEGDMIDSVPEIGGDLLANIPRLGAIARIVRYQAKHYDGSGHPKDSVAGEEIPVGARILKVVSDLLRFEQKEISHQQAFQQMKARNGWYDPCILDSAVSCLSPEAGPAKKAKVQRIAIAIRDLRPGQVLAANLETREGSVLLAAGYKLTGAAIMRLRNIASSGDVRHPVFIEELLPTP